MNEGKYVFTQVTSLIPRQVFQRLVKKYNGDHRVREFNCTNQLKYMLGCSENGVKTHLWIAICSYLLLARIKAMYDSPYPITEIGTLVRVFALVKTDLQKLVKEPQPLILNQDVKEPTLQIPPISATGSLKESEHICS